MTVLVSLIIMQASRNFSDIWLAHWIRSINSLNDTVQISYNTTEIDLKAQANSILWQALCYIHKIFLFGDLSECLSSDSSNATEERAYSQNSYYLAIYISIAMINSLIALLRAFTFAYAGIKAAKFIHNRLLQSVIFVSSRSE